MRGRIAGHDVIGEIVRQKQRVERTPEELERWRARCQATYDTADAILAKHNSGQQRATVWLNTPMVDYTSKEGLSAQLFLAQHQGDATKECVTLWARYNPADNTVDTPIFDIMPDNLLKRERSACTDADLNECLFLLAGMAKDLQTQVTIEQ